MYCNVIIDDAVNDAVINKLILANFAGTLLDGRLKPDTRPNRFVDIDLSGMPDPDESVTNGDVHISRYNLADIVIFLQTGTECWLHIYPVDAVLIDLFDNWDFGETERCIGMAEFGFSDGPAAACITDNDVRIWRTPYYYVGTYNAPCAHFARDGDYDQLVFNTFEDAQRWIDDNDGQIYYLSNGEYARPDFKIVQ